MGSTGPPEFQEITGHAAGRADDHVLGPAGFVDDADDVGLGQRGGVSTARIAVDGTVPFRFECLDFIAIRGIDTVTAFAQGGEERDSIAARASQTSGKAPALWASIDETLMPRNAHVRMLEGGVEAVVKSDNRVPIGDDQIGGGGEAVGSESAVGADRASIPRMGPREAAFPCLVSQTGMPSESAKSVRAAVASL